MAKTEKRYIITNRKGCFTSREYKSGPLTLAEAIMYYSYTLECGVSYQYEKGNKKINCNPKTIKGLITNLTNAQNNSAANGYGGHYSYEEYVPEIA